MLTSSRKSNALADPAPGAYRPFAAARRPGGPPDERPVYRVLVHRQSMAVWSQLAERVGLENARQFWDHVAFTPGEPPKVGTSSIMRGRHAAPKGQGFSRTIHYEITGAGRIDYQWNPAYTGGAHGDPHGVVWILTIDLGSH